MIKQLIQYDVILIPLITDYNPSAVKKLLANGADANAIEHGENITAVEAAADLRMSKTLRLLFEYGAKVSPEIAARLNVKELFIHNLKILAHNLEMNIFPCAPLLYAIIKQDLDSVKALVKEIEDINSAINGKQPLLWAAEIADLELVRFFIDCGADVNQRDDLGCAAIDYAVKKTNVPIVKLLIERGADLHSSPLIFKALCSNSNTKLETIKLLLLHGADVDAKYENFDEICMSLLGNTAFMTAAYFPGELEYAKLLLAHGADINATNADGQMALMLAAARGRLETVEFLLKNGANTSVTDNFGKTALKYALEYSKLDNADFNISEILVTTLLLVESLPRNFFL